MPSLKDVKTKIGGVKKTSQITKAMNMVAAAKLRGAQSKMEAFRPYAEQFHAAMASLSAGTGGARFPLMEVREVKKVELVVVTSDRGLCGSFNANILKVANRAVAELEAAGKKVSLVCVGKKARNFFRKSGKMRKDYIDIMGTFQMFNARAIAQDAAANFLSGEADEVRLIYGRFHSVALQRPEQTTILPIKPIEGEAGGAAAPASQAVYIYEPSQEEIMEVLLPMFLNVMVYHSMLEVSASEHAARMTAMDNATRACKDIINNLTLIYNKTRQAGITSELMDIVGGAEALKG
ncbi:MAG TPA: ATP synthase F1 subunit gamma [Desulfurivibrio alkaliphilus]|uniref:ATP synthase gamma chain n=1 Tax=Desulfurivibrio alkaliphilus TaxID=427923 RepID=A0A7C2X964_9BACT|nr:ATP synthase F1 subunit gamma [Desulfurivibrio alkaliphilus]